jgi:hypothetical protein
MVNIKILIISILCIIVFSCSPDIKKPNIDSVKVNIKVLRFEKDLFNSDFDNIEDSLAFFKGKYGEFFNIFNYKIIRVGDFNSSSYPPMLKGFLTDYNINKLSQTVDSTFSNFSETEKSINKMFRYYKYYFPEMRIPTIVTYISGFNQSIVTTDTILGIGLDKYLGRYCFYYDKLGLPNYMKNNMEPYRIPYDCASAWAITQFPLNDPSLNFLSNLIYKGKVAYFIKSLFPDSPDSLVLALSKNQMEWCKANEKQMWTYLVENRILFKTDFMTIKKFIDEAPYTKDFGRNSPGRAIVWCGFMIVTEYMKNQQGATLQGLMLEKDFQKILRISKYKP